MSTLNRVALCAAMLITLLAGRREAHATERRIALLVGHPLGGQGLAPLRYVAHDIARMREVLHLLGGFGPNDIHTSMGKDADGVLQALSHVEGTIRDHVAHTGERPLFLFYYTGHAQDGVLRLGDSRLSMREIKTRMENSHAVVRLALLDACRSGSITRLKGAAKAAPISLAVENVSSQRGVVLITASSADEDAQESDDIQGSFFTHYLTSGLRGAADQNDDGHVTLSEAYQHAYANTVARTVGSRGGTQHPTYHYDLRGTGDVILTRVNAQPSAIHFPRGLSGDFVVFDLKREVVVAEFHKQHDRASRLAVRPGVYVVKKRETDHLRMQHMTVPKHATAMVDPTKMRRVAFADDYAKGVVVTTEQVLYGKVGVRLTTAMGAQTFLSAPASEDYFPNLRTLQLTLDLDNLFRRNMGLRLDLGFGGSGERPLALSDPYLGDLSYRVEVNQLTAGIAITTLFSITELFQVGGQARIGWILVHRAFVGGALPDQGFTTLTPGVGVEAAIKLNSWLRLGAAVRVHYMFFHVDKPMNLAFLDGAIVLTAVLR